MAWPIIAAAAISAVAASKKSADDKAAAQGGKPIGEQSTETASGVNVTNPYAPFQPALGQIAGGINQAMQTPWSLPGQTYAGTDPYQQQGMNVAAGSLQAPWTMGQGAPGLSELQQQGVAAVQGSAAAPWQLPDQTLAGVDPYQQQGLNQMAALSGPGGPLAGIEQGSLGAYQQALDPMSNINDVTMGPLDAYSRRVGRNINEQVMPGISQGATAAGQQGSSRQGIAEGLAARGGAEAIADYGSNLMANLYGQGVQSRNQALGMTPMMQQAQGYGAQNLFGVGTQQQTFAQQAFDDARMRNEYRQQEGLARGDALFGAGGIQQGAQREQLLDERTRDMFAQQEGLTRGQNLFGIGQQGQALSQAELDDIRMRQEYQQQEPFQRYGAGAEIAYGGAQLGGTETADLTKTTDTTYDYSAPGKSEFNFLDPMGMFG